MTPWTAACQALLYMELSRQEYWSGLPFPSLGDLPNPGIEPGSLALQVDSLPAKPPGKPHKEYSDYIIKFLELDILRLKHQPAESFTIFINLWKIALTCPGLIFSSAK